MVVIRVRCWDRWRAWRSFGETVLRLFWWWFLLVRGGVAGAVVLDEDFDAAGGRPLLDNDERMDVDMVAIFYYLFTGWRDPMIVGNNVQLRKTVRDRYKKDFFNQ